MLADVMWHVRRYSPFLRRCPVMHTAQTARASGAQPNYDSGREPDRRPTRWRWLPSETPTEACLSQTTYSIARRSSPVHYPLTVSLGDLRLVRTAGHRDAARNPLR